MIDQAQHFAALGPAGGGQSADVAQTFREGLDGTERECECLDKSIRSVVTKYHECCSVFARAGKYQADKTMV